MSDEAELLTSLSDDELEALAESKLAPSAQARLDELLARNADHPLVAAEQAELDRLLARVDQLTILKTRARYTLRQQAGATNRYKANRTVAADPDTQQEVPLFHPHRETWTDHFAWNDDATELMARTATGRATIAALRMNRPQLIRVRRLWAAMGEHPPDAEWA